MADATAARTAREGRLSAIEQELGDFSYIVSHDLTASFRQISGFLGLLTSDLDESLTPSQRGYANHVQDAVEKCNLMLEQLLAYSRAQHAVLEIEECDATLLVESARLQLSQAVRESGAEINVGPLGRVCVDQGLVVNAFKRVLENAIKFRRPDTPPRVDIKASMDSDRWVCRVTDNGVGAASDQHEKLFQMFYRLDPQAANAGVGSGLTLARRIMRRHGGDVRFIEHDGGACVEIHLPGDACAAAPGG